MRRVGRFAIVMLVLIMSATCFAGCGDKYGGKTPIKFYAYGSDEEAQVYNQIVDTYNKTNTDNVYVEVEYFPSTGYENMIDKMLAGASGPDIIFVGERYIKRWAKFGYLENLQSRIEASNVDLDDMWYSNVQRHRYNPAKNTNNADDDLYCLPKDVSPTALYYNKTVIEAQGIKIISVDEDKIDAFNNEGAADNTGKTKADYGIEGTVLKKGFQRDNPYNGLSWTKPTYGANGKVLETMIFNNRIPMSWDEVEDLGMILTKKANSDLKDPSGNMEWGYFTEWWFNYGWGVGGDCAVDTTGEGDWEFTLGDTKRKCLLYNSDGSYAYNDLHQNIFVDSDKISEYPLKDGQYFGQPLPSMREAFDRFVQLSCTRNNRGVAVAPTPAQLGTSTYRKFFTQGKVGLMVQQNYIINMMRAAIGNSFDWDVAPLPMYKEYVDINGDEVKNHGICIGHSGSASAGIWTGSKHKDEAFSFVAYMCGPESQTLISHTGSTMCNQRSLVEKEYIEPLTSGGLPPQNVRVFAEYADIQRPGDWWYMPDDAWIDEWANVLNTSVRNGTMTVDQMFAEKTASTQAILEKYKTGGIL